MHLIKSIFLCISPDMKRIRAKNMMKWIGYTKYKFLMKEHGIMIAMRMAFKVQ